MKELIAKDLLDIQAVFLRPNEPFTWASGIKSPIYCDNRLTLSYPKVRKDVETGLAKLVQENFPEAECLMGTATAGIAHAALVADILELPMGYVRGGAKSHGRNNRIEGKVEPGMKVVVVEDLISTGGSSLECVEALKEAGCEVIGKKDFTTNADGSAELSRLMPKEQDVKEHAKDIDAIVNQKVKAELEKIREEEKVKKQKREELKKAAKKHKEDMERAQMSLFD